MTQKTCKPISVTEDVYWKLVELKFMTRSRSLDEVLRSQLGLPSNNELVKRYSDEVTAAMKARS